MCKLWLSWTGSGFSVWRAQGLEFGHRVRRGLFIPQRDVEDPPQEGKFTIHSGWRDGAGGSLVRYREPSGRVRYQTDEEEQRLMKALPDDDSRNRVHVLLHTGFRRGELLGVQWRDVDFKAGVLTIPKSKNGETRYVPMTSMVRTLIFKRPRPLDGSALVFPNSEGHRDLRWATKTVPAALRAAMVPGFRFHDLRHTFASRLAMEGIELMTIRELLGHKSMAMTLRYAHLSPGHRRVAIERLVSRQAAPVEAQASGAE